MKRIMKKSIIAISLLAIICCGCKEHDRNENMTLRGKAISDVWFNATKCIMENMVVPSFKLEAWINADDSMKTVIANKYFQHLQVRQFGEGTGVYEILDGNTLIYSVNTYNKSITDPDVEWEVTTYPPYKGDNNYYSAMPQFVYTDSFNIIKIKKEGTCKWQIFEKEGYLSGSKIALGIRLPLDTIIPTDILEKDINLIGKGSYIYTGSDFEDATKENPVALQFVISQMLTHNAAKELKWRSGQVTFTASKKGCDDVNATVTYQGERLIIDYKNITESWDN